MSRKLNRQETMKVLRVRCGRLESTLKEVLDLAVDVEVGQKTSAAAMHEVFLVVEKALRAYRPAGLKRAIGGK
jgi:hypothetical protein